MVKTYDRNIELVLACCQNILCAGCIFGWSAISESLLPDVIRGPGLDSYSIQRIFIYSVMLNCSTVVLQGFVMDWLGPRVCNVFSLLLAAFGNLLCGVSTPSNSSLYFLIGIASLSIAGAGVQISVFHISNRFPDAKGTVTSIITGCFNVSTGVFLIFNKIWQAGVSYQMIFICYSILCFTFAILGAVIFPGHLYDSVDELENSMDSGFDRSRIVSVDSLRINYRAAFGAQLTGKRDRAASVDDFFHTSILRKPSRYNLQALVKGEIKRLPSVFFPPELPKPPSIKRESLINQLRSFCFWKLTIFLTFGFFWANLYLGFVARQSLAQYYMSSTSIQAAIQFFVLCSCLGGPFFAVIFGILFDKIGFAKTVMIGCSCGLLHSLSFIFQNWLVLYANFIVFNLYTAFQLTYCFARLGDELGFRFFGILSGLICFMSGIVGLLQQDIVDFTTSGCSLGTHNECDSEYERWWLVNVIKLIMFFAFTSVLCCIEVKTEQWDEQLKNKNEPAVTAVAYTYTAVS